MFCFHKYGKVEDDGYQYCSKCGKAKKVPCNHKWEIIAKCGNGQFVVSKCEKCGSIRSYDVANPSLNKEM